jgi:hypothetical protein
MKTVAPPPPDCPALCLRFARNECGVVLQRAVNQESVRLLSASIAYWSGRHSEPVEEHYNPESLAGLL